MPGEEARSSESKEENRSSESGGKSQAKRIRSN
jgi:hypothetical protein